MDNFTWGLSGSVSKTVKAALKEDRMKSAETAALTERCAGEAVAAAASKEALQAVVVKDFESSEVLNTYRPVWQP